MKTLVRGLLVVSVVALSTMLASAATVSFTGSGTNGDGNPVGGQADFTTSANTVTLDLINTLLRSQTEDAGQLLTDLQFTLSNVSTGTASITSGTGTLAEIADNGTFTTSSGNVDWSLSPTASGNSTFTLDFNPGATKAIIGNGGSGNFSGNGSINGNPGHNPFTLGTAHFVLNIPGVTSSTTISATSFSFGTDHETNIPGGGSPIPEPSTLLVLGGSLLAVVLYRKKVSAV
jgi:hypothetical protein